MRRALLVLLATLYLAPAAHAQDTGTPVVGGGSFNSAPILEPGTYRDTILPAEYLYYGFRLAGGQHLRVTVTHPDITGDAVERMGVIWLSGNIHTPTRTLADSVPGDKPYIGFGGGEAETLTVSSPDVTAEEDRSDHGAWTSAGVSYLALHAVVARGTQNPPRAEIPLTFAAEVVGTAVPNATLEPTATPSPRATATATPAPASEADDGPSAAIAAIGGVGGILIGVIAGIAGRRPRR